MMRLQRPLFLSALTLAIPGLIGAPGGAAAAPQQRAESIEVSPEELELRVGESVQLEVTVRDGAGAVIEDAPVLFIPMWGQFWNLQQRTWGFNLFNVSGDGLVTASKPGEYAVVVRVPRQGGDGFLDREVPLRIARPEITEIEILEPPTRAYTGTTLRLRSRLVDGAGDLRPDIAPTIESSDANVARIGEDGRVRFVGAGPVTLTATADSARDSLELQVEDNPGVALALQASHRRVRTGDVVIVEARVVDAGGAAVEGAPIAYSFNATTDQYAVGGPTSGLIEQDGRFVADLPGEYEIFAHSGSFSDSVVVTAVPRAVARKIELVGHGRVKDRATSDLWVWEAPDGRDYAITGTHTAEGHAYIWDVTDPSNIVIADTVRVDARTVNDVKVSEDGRLAVISRSGASNRRNGIVILDVSRPTEGVTVLSRFDDGLTGGVHNLFVHDGHVYALSAGQRYDIINIEDPTNPHRVGRFELENHDRSIHDVWVADGIAYSANWNDGVVMVDVGGGDAGGSPRNPVEIGRFKFPTGWNHAVYPYRSRSTGKFYLFAGDEAARTGRFSPEPEVGSGTPGYEGEPARWRGWIHVLEWEPGPGNEPRIVARYEVPEAGSHNIWVEDDVMYVAFYNGGLRVVDVSGELMGNLYRQGREMAYFLPFDPEGFNANSPQVWGAQPFKGNIFFSDQSSGVWAVRLVDDTGAETSER